MTFFGLFALVIKILVLVQTIGGGVMVATTTVTVPSQLVVGTVVAACLARGVNYVGNTVSSASSQSVNPVVTTCLERKTIDSWLLTNSITHKEVQKVG